MITRRCQMCNARAAGALEAHEGAVGAQHAERDRGALAHRAGRRLQAARVPRPARVRVYRALRSGVRAHRVRLIRRCQPADAAAALLASCLAEARALRLGVRTVYPLRDARLTRRRCRIHGAAVNHCPSLASTLACRILSGWRRGRLCASRSQIWRRGGAPSRHRQAVRAVEQADRRAVAVAQRRKGLRGVPAAMERYFQFLSDKKRRGTAQRSLTPSGQQGCSLP